MGHPVCPKCYQEILPGSDVTLTVLDDDPGRRIFTDEDMIVSHVVCPAATATVTTIRPCPDHWVGPIPDDCDDCVREPARPVDGVA